MKWPSCRGGMNCVLRNGKNDKPMAITNRDEIIINLDCFSISNRMVSYLPFKNLTTGESSVSYVRITNHQIT